MKKSLKSLVISIFLFSFVTTFAQGRMGEVGKLFHKDEADKLFGKPKQALQINPKLLQKALLKAKDYVLFTIKNGKILILDEKKHSLTDDNEKLDRLETAYIFSKSKVLEFLNAAFGNNPMQINNPKERAMEILSTTADPIYVEDRSSTLTLSAANSTLELSTLCPPVCFE
ncbi:hypothetical protein [Stygiobacter electus]|uniref:Uncharacterized protein n=1 Tax=Stygiobacter electus TaxID=3032292 RepID=A0AAE3NXZ3_9BACT|nr:hypothetical protein [Stygiobacter electus]MDF1612986.1 hypothetical protein [Stygiobacter electus]